MDPLVTPAWLAARLQDPMVAILDATLLPVGVRPPAHARASYLADHIPGAVFFDIEEISNSSSPLPHMLPEAPTFAHSMSDLGLSNSMTIIVYEQAGVYSAPRAWWTIRAFGADKVYLLDGGLAAWQQAGLPTESGEVRRSRSSFAAKLDHGAVKSFAEVQQLIRLQGQILDARSVGRFDGTAPEPRPGVASGHMPGAINIPFVELLKGNHLRPVDELHQIFAAKGVNLAEPITTSCGSGLTAAVLNLGLELAGAKTVSLYDGSWTEYARKPDVVIETTPP